MGYYALAGKEQDKRLKYLLKTFMQTDINKRRDYVKTLSLPTVEKAMGKLYHSLLQVYMYRYLEFITSPGQLPHILPDYMLVFAVPILAHDPEFTNNTDVSQLKVIQQCLWYILEPLITKNEFYCYGFYKNLVERMKSHKDALKPEDDNVNYVS